jgi:hypothetical protein
MVALALWTTVAPAQQTLFFLGTNETDKPWRIQHAYDLKWDRVRLAGLTNLDPERYQLKPRLSFDFVQQKELQLEVVYQKEWFQNSFVVQTRRGPVEREVQLNVDRVGLGMRNQYKWIRNELMVFAYDSDTNGQRVEDVLFIRLPNNFGLNNQFWHDFETNVTFNQTSLLYAVQKNVGVVVQYNTISNRDAVTRAGVWVRF